jgi:hypothetical protein
MAGDQVRLEYDRAVALFSQLTDVRFKLLALVPTLSGTAVGFLRAGQSAITLLAVGLLGVAATAGVLVYELRNSEIRTAVGARIGALEDVLFERKRIVTKTDRRVFGVQLDHDFGLALVYSAALAGWGYLVAWGGLSAAHAGHARGIGVAVGSAWGLFVLFKVLRLGER